MKECDVITTATTSSTPVFSVKEVNAFCHINAIGSLGKNRTEISSETLLASRLLVDQREACMAEAGEICLMRDAGLLPEDFHVEEIGELIENRHIAPEIKTKRTVFKSVGNAVQDLVCVAELLRSTEQRQSIEL